MPQGELWEATPRDKLRAEAFERTPWGKKDGSGISRLCNAMSQSAR